LDGIIPLGWKCLSPEAPADSTGCFVEPDSAALGVAVAFTGCFDELISSTSEVAVDWAGCFGPDDFCPGPTKINTTTSIAAIAITAFNMMLVTPVPSVSIFQSFPLIPAVGYLGKVA
jgi:hypothetical protein